MNYSTDGLPTFSEAVCVDFLHHFWFFEEGIDRGSIIDYQKSKIK